MLRTPGTEKENGRYTALNGQRSVLIVDRSEDTREVLRTVLERRGVRTLAASRPGRGLDLARRHQPNLIVLDLEIDDSDPQALCAAFAAQSRAQRGSLVVLGSVARRGEQLGAEEIISKPYDYGPLIRKIEELLGSSSPMVTRCA